MKSRSKRYWVSQIDLYKKSGLSAVKFCQQEKIAYSTFRKWFAKISASSEFLTLKVVKEKKRVIPEKETQAVYEEEKALSLELHLPQGWILRTSVPLSSLPAVMKSLR